MCAAHQAVLDNLENNMAVGIGSGSTIVFAVQKIAEIVKEKNWTVHCIPTSLQAKQLIIENNLLLCELNQFPILHVTFDGADEVDFNGNLIKGGGGAHTMEKIVAYSSKKLIILIDESKKSRCLGNNWKRGIPVEVLPFATETVKRNIRSGIPILRMATNKAGPIITDLGNVIFDVQFEKFPLNLLEWNETVTKIPGVIETGLFLKMNLTIYVGNEKGEVYTTTHQSQ